MSIFVKTTHPFITIAIPEYVTILSASFEMKIAIILIFLVFKTDVFPLMARNKREQKALKSMESSV